MTLVLAVLLAASLVANAALALHTRLLTKERDEARAEARDDKNRLLAAWKDGYVVPAPAPEPERPIEESLSAELMAIVTEWESEAGQEAQLKIIRDLLRQGKTQPEVLHLLLPNQA